MASLADGQGVAFFDLDRTLISVNSASLWIKREVRLGHLPRWQAVRAGWWIGLYHLGVVDLNGAIKKAISTLAGVDAAAVIQRTADFWEEEVAHTLRERVRLDGLVETKTAEGKAQAWVMGLMPPALAALLWHLDPDMMRPLVADPAGWGILGLVAALEVVGVLWVRRVTAIEA